MKSFASAANSLLLQWEARLAEWQKLCPSSCRGEMDAIEECIEELKSLLAELERTAG